MSDWTDERRERAISLYREGQSAAQVATALGGVSRNAVIGMLHRAGVTSGYRAKLGTASSAMQNKMNAGTFGASKPKVARSASVRGVAPHSFGPRTVEEVKATIETAVRERRAPTLVAVAEHNRPFHALGARMCRFPISLDVHEEATTDSLFCAAPASEGEVYCDDCRSLAWRPPAKVGADYARSLRKFHA